MFALVCTIRANQVGIKISNNGSPSVRPSPSVHQCKIARPVLRGRTTDFALQVPPRTPRPYRLADNVTFLSLSALVTTRLSWTLPSTGACVRACVRACTYVRLRVRGAVVVGVREECLVVPVGWATRDAGCVDVVAVCLIVLLLPLLCTHAYVVCGFCGRNGASLAKLCGRGDRWRVRAVSLPLQSV